jgi:hypothetical protein
MLDGSALQAAELGEAENAPQHLAGRVAASVSRRRVGEGEAAHGWAIWISTRRLSITADV